MSVPPETTRTDLLAENAALRELLDVYEATTIEQAKKLGQTLHELGESGRRLLAAEREASRLAREQTLRLEREFAIASHIQTSILPRSFELSGFDVAAILSPAERVGGDYYDIIATPRGCWLGIGDVTGHGLTAGLIMMMTQSAVASLVRRDPELRPLDALEAVNEVLVENIRRRLREREHMTLTLLRVDSDGRVAFAGAHEELLVHRSASRAIERFATPGTWSGVRSELREVNPESMLQLEPGDILLLHTDGIIEARAPESREQYGIERLLAALAAVADEPCSEICASLVRGAEAWTPPFDDDLTLVALRRLG